MKKFAVILAGCGVYDGAEIHEATLTLLAIKKNEADYEIFAPDVPQHHVINHLTGEEMKETRNVLVESARIARGAIKPLSELDVNQFDAVVIPGGFGVAKNLCDFAFKGADCSLNEEVELVLKKFHELRKPIGALCISPVLIAKALGKVQLTIGQDAATAKAVEKLGAKHIPTNHGDVVTDDHNKVFTTPCYMLDADILDIEDGAMNIIGAMIDHMK
jgi:enhancing lycopene biosynthesis protein 2